MIDEKTKADIRKRLQKETSDDSPLDAQALALHYKAHSNDEHKDLVEFICQEAKKTGAPVIV